MTGAGNTFLVDVTGFLEASQKAFLGAACLRTNGEDQTFVFGVVRDLLQLRHKLGIARGIVVISAEGNRVTSAQNISKTSAFLTQIRIPIVHDSHKRMVDLCAGATSIVNHIVTHDLNLLQFANGNLRVVILKDKKDIEVFSEESVVSKFGVAPQSIPEFLALTSGPAPTVLTKREAIGLLQRPGDLAGRISDPTFLSSRRLRNKLKMNGTTILQRIKELSPSTPVLALELDRDKLEVDIDNDGSRLLLDTHGFYSLRRLLPEPAGVPSLQEASGQSPPRYHAITSEADLERVVRQLRTSECCAVDTESSGKDPHSAELFGISISGRQGGAFYVPFEHGPKWIEPTTIAPVLNKLFQSSIKVLGHNLKYDYVLLKRKGINIAHIDFDTMLAAYDCFGDSDLLNLQYLSKRLLGRTIKAHKDIVREGHTLLDVPFQDVVNYACEHAEVTLQLAGTLQQELADRKIEDQYRNVTLPMVKKLGDWECVGIPVDLGRLRRLRDSAAEQVARSKEAAVARVGSPFNADSYREVTAVLKTDNVLAAVIGFRSVNARLLEELAISHELPRLLVRYQRSQKRLRNIELVIQSVQNGRVRPVFSQTSTDHCRLLSVKPRLLDLDIVADLRSCLPKALRVFCADARKALTSLGEEAADNVLRGDLVTASRSGCFRNFPVLNDGNHFQLLLSFVTGISDHQLCRIFLLDRNSIECIRHDFQIRYSKTFQWLEKFRETTATNGFASACRRRRYFDGIRSSDLEKRSRALQSAVKWLVRW